MPESQYFTNQRILKMPKYLPMKLRFSPDGNHLVVWGTHHKEVWIWDLTTQAVIRKLRKPKREDPDFVYTQDGKYLIGLRSRTKDKPKEYVLYETKTYREVDAWPTPIAFHGSKMTPDNLTMSYYSGRKKNENHIKLRILDIPEKRIVNQISGVDGFDMIAFQPDGKGFADSTTQYIGKMGDDDFQIKYHIRLWSYPDLKLRLMIEDASLNKIVGLAFSSDGQRLFSWSGSSFSPEWYLKHTGKKIVKPGYKEPIRIWDTSTGDEVGRIEGIFVAITHDSMHLVDDKYLILKATGDKNNSEDIEYNYILIVDIATGKAIADFRLSGLGYRTDLRLSPNNKTVATIVDKGVILVDLELPGIEE